MLPRSEYLYWGHSVAPTGVCSASPPLRPLRHTPSSLSLSAPPLTSDTSPVIRNSNPVARKNPA